MPAPTHPAHDDLAAYVASIEAALTRQRGRVVELAGHDFALARAWHAGGVPLAVVLASIAEHAVGRGSLSLAYLRRHIEARARRSRATQIDSGVGVAGATATPTGMRDDVDAARDWLTRLRAWFELRADDAASPFTALRGQACALEARLEAHALPTAPELDAAASTLDEALSEAAVGVCGDQAAERFRAEAARAVARQRGRLDEASLDEALRRYVRRRARAACGVPERG